MRTQGEKSSRVFLDYANNEPKSALARDLDDSRDNKGKLAKRVFTCFISQEMPMELSMKLKGTACLRFYTSLP